MKIKGRCRGCDSIRLINALDLCKRCNRTSTEFIPHAEMMATRSELDILAKSASSRKAKTKLAEEEKKEAEEKEAGEEEGAEGKEEPKEEKK